MGVVLALCAPQAALAGGPGDDHDDQTVVVNGVRARDEAELGPLGRLPIKDTPFSINILDAEDIARTQARTLGELLRQEPGVTSSVNAGSYANNVELRGFPIASLFEGMPNEASDFTYRQDTLFNVGRVTVLRGVSSFAYGGATFIPVGGAVDVLPKYPTAEPLTQVTFGFAADARALAAVDVSRRLSSGLGLRLNLGAEGGDGPVDAQRNNRNRTAAASFDLSLAPGLSLLGGVEYARNVANGYRDTLGLAAGLDVPRAPRGRTNISQRWARYPAESVFGWGRLGLERDGWEATLKGVAGWSDRSYISTFGTVTDANGDATLFPSAYDNAIRNESAEASVARTFRTGAIEHRLSLGANWARERSYFRTDFANSGVLIDPIPTNIYRPVRVPEPELGDVEGPDRPSSYTKGYGVAATYTLVVGPVTVIAGARRAWLEGADYFDPAAPRTATSRFDQAKTTPVLAGTVALTGRLTAYASYAEGLETGGTAPAGTVNALQRLPVRATEQVEAGLKWQPAPDLLVTAAIFQAERPLEFIDFSASPQGEYVQDGRQRHRGVELSVNGRVARGTSLSGGLILLDPEQRDTGDPALQGNRPSGVPKYRVTVTGEQELVGGLSAIATVERQGSVFLDIGNTQRVPAWTRLDLGAAWRTSLGGRETTLRATVDNVTGERYWAGAQFGTLTFGTPERVWRVSASTVF